MFRIKIIEDEYWWGGSSAEAAKGVMPLSAKSEYTVDLRKTGNQTMPLFISSKGRYVYSNGDYYEGAFENDIRAGVGLYVWSNGETYEGEFKNNTMWGLGTYKWPSGRTYKDGYFEDGVIVRTDEDVTTRTPAE